MYIEELKGAEALGSAANTAVDVEEAAKELCSGVEVLCKSDGRGGILVLDAKRVLVGAGARALFYPTLLYNVVRNKIQAEFRWWDWVDEFVLLGAVPFQSDVHRLKALGVGGVVTLNEPYETLVPSYLYHVNGIRHLVLPTRDYLFAPSLRDLSRAVEFIHVNASCRRSTYVHCKAGRGRSTTVVICYLVKYKHMTPDAAYSYVKSIRPRVLLATSQWKAVQDFYQLQGRHACILSHPTSLITRSPRPLAPRNHLAFDDGSVVVITQSDLDGYDPKNECCAASDDILANLDLMYRVRVAALARLSCIWFHCRTQKISDQEDTEGNSCFIGAKQHGGFTVDIHFYS